MVVGSVQFTVMLTAAVLRKLVVVFLKARAISDSLSNDDIQPCESFIGPGEACGSLNVEACGRAEMSHVDKGLRSLLTADSERKKRCRAF